MILRGWVRLQDTAAAAAVQFHPVRARGAFVVFCTKVLYLFDPPGFGVCGGVAGQMVCGAPGAEPRKLTTFGWLAAGPQKGTSQKGHFTSSGLTKKGTVSEGQRWKRRSRWW